MCRDDVPEQHLVLDAQLAEDAVDHRRARLCRAAAGQLPLRGEGDAADPCAAVAGGLADEDDARVTFALEVRGQALAPHAGAAVLVERVADPSRGELFYQCSQRTTSSSGFQGNFRREPCTGADAS